MGRVKAQKSVLGVGAAPVVALEEVGEADVVPGIQLRRRRLDVNPVDEADSADDLRSLRGRDDRLDSLDLSEHLVADDAGDEDVAVLLGVAKDVQMPDMEEVERSCGVADALSHVDSPDSPMPGSPAERPGSPAVLRPV